jgi:hypothetical protein
MTAVTYTLEAYREGFDVLTISVLDSVNLWVILALNQKWELKTVAHCVRPLYVARNLQGTPARLVCSNRVHGVAHSNVNTPKIVDKGEV